MRTFYPDIMKYRIDTKARLSETRIKRDIKFGIHYLVGELPVLKHNYISNTSNISFSFSIHTTVSIGGAAALFLGCSFISLIEPIYFVTKHLCPEKMGILDRQKKSVTPTRSMNRITKFTKRYHFYLNHSGLHGIRYLDHRFRLIDRYEEFLLVLKTMDHC